MTRQELQSALKEFRNQNLTEISLNSKTEVLQAEYSRIVEEEKQHVTSIGVDYNNECLRVTSKGIRGEIMIKHFLQDAITVEDLVNSKYVTVEYLATIESFKIPVLEQPTTTENGVDQVELESLNSIRIAGVKVTTMTTEALANEFICIDGIETAPGYQQLEDELAEGNWTESLRLKTLRFIAEFVKDNDECAAA